MKKKYKMHKSTKVIKKNMTRSSKRLTMSALYLACGIASAANWNNGGTGDNWTDPANWAGNLPAAGVVTYMDNSDTAVIYPG